jgi:hypothetical protein
MSKNAEKFPFVQICTNGRSVVLHGRRKIVDDWF